MAYFSGPETYPPIANDLHREGFALVGITGVDRDRACRVMTDICGFPVAYVWADQDVLIDASRWSDDQKSWKRFLRNRATSPATKIAKFIARAEPGSFEVNDRT